VIAQRVLAVLAAFMLIGAFALATLGPPGVPLGHVLFTLDTPLMDWLQEHSPVWLWRNLVAPVLLRPAWLMPAAVGIVMAGASLTLASRPETHRSRHQRR
jgi:hypothetical protein